ncbi:unnamed protein product [Rhizophagus irregularis]|nr:unnamed protein product [Rhizophagus irregularis]CAB5200446.1 unnamed protein product [Rhizophagus irregularis]
METTDPDSIIEWIPYSNLININYLAKGGYSEIYTSEWIHGKYDEWDSKEQQLKRLGEQDVVLKRLENFESANKRWFEEAISHLNIKENDISETNSLENYTSNSKLFTSKVHQFENLSEPRNATEEEQQAFHSNKSCDFHIPNHIDDFGNLSNQNNNSSKIINSNKSFKRRLENDFQEIMQQMKRNRINIDDEEDMYNNPNFHPEEQDEFELPENMDEN